MTNYKRSKYYLEARKIIVSDIKDFSNVTKADIDQWTEDLLRDWDAELKHEIEQLGAPYEHAKPS